MQKKECGLVFEENGRLFINIEEKKKKPDGVFKTAVNGTPSGFI